MTWSKLSDDYSDDAWTLSDAAFRLHTEGLVWSNRKLLDCAIPKDDLRRFAKTPEAVQELLDAGFWTDAGPVYIIRHHAQYQRQREAVLKQQEANQKNALKGGRRPKAKPREQKSDSVSESHTHGANGAFLEAPPPLDLPTHINTGKKTQSVSDSLRESETKRDRPGIEGINPVENLKTSRMTPEEDEAWLRGVPVVGGTASTTSALACSAHGDVLVLASCEECKGVLASRRLRRLEV